MGWLAAVFDISLATANRFYSLGWGLSVTGAMITLIGVGLLFWGTRVRDRDFEHSIAVLHDRAANAEKATAWRRLTPAQFQAIPKAFAVVGSKMMLMQYSDDPETSLYARYIELALEESGKPTQSGRTNSIDYFGLFVSGPDSEVVAGIIKTLNESGLSVQDLGSSELVTFHIGPKPPPR
jgi:hypothetical protein